MCLFENIFLGVNSCWSLPVSCLCTQTEALLSWSLPHNSEVVPTSAFLVELPPQAHLPKQSRSEFSIKTIPCFWKLEKWGESSECQWCTTCKPRVLLVWSLNVPFNLSLVSLLIYPLPVLYYIKSMSLWKSLSPDVTKLWQRCRTLSCSQKWFVQREKAAISLSPAYFPILFVNKIVLMGSKYCEDALYYFICF